jgi:hypothetical protein
MGFWSDLFGGPSQQQQNLSNQQATLADTFSSNYNQRFGAQSQEFSALQGQLSPIAALGPSQMGWSPQLAATVSTQNINAAGAAARNAAQATGSVLAGRGGGGAGSGLTSGIDASIRGTEASAAENQLSASQLQATEANAAQGNQNYNNAVSGEMALANAENPASAGGMATQATQSALSDANQITQEKQSAAFAPISLATKAIGGALGFATGGLSNLSSDSSFGENVGNFFSGGMNSSGTGTQFNAGQNALSQNLNAGYED